MTRTSTHRVRIFFTERTPAGRSAIINIDGKAGDITEWRKLPGPADVIECTLTWTDDPESDGWLRGFLDRGTARVRG